MLDTILTPAAQEWVAGFRAVHCGHPDCRRWLTQRALETRRAGVRVGEDWFCCWVCAAPRIAERLAELAAAEAGEVHAPRMPLGMVLVQQGRLTYERFREAEEFERESGMELGEALVHLGLCEEKQVLAARAVQWGCPVFAPALKPAAIPVQLPMTLLRRYGMAPMHYVPATRSLLMGFLHRVEYSALYAVDRVCGCNTKACFISPAEFALRMEMQAGAPKEVVTATVESAHAMATRVASLGAESGAEEVVLGRAPHFLWVRVLGGKTAQDLLFRVA